MRREEQAARERRFGGIPAVDLATVVAVCAVVLLVSLPCLRDFAVRENEREACALLPGLFELVNKASRGPGSAPEGVDLHALAQAEAGATQALGVELRDARPGPSPGTLLHHGYVYDVGAGARGRRTVVAWPLEYGRTGLRSFAFGPDLGLVLHANPTGVWSGGSGPREASLAGGWTRTAR